MASSSKTRASAYRETAAEFRRLAQFVSAERAETLAEGASALDAKAARIDKGGALPRLVRRLAGRG